MSSSKKPEQYEIVWPAVATADVESILRYTAAHWSVSQARRLHSKLRSRTKTLSRFPLRCRIVPELRALGVLDGRRDLE